jgi:group II intron reverse transcriptase/maturase
MNAKANNTEFDGRALHVSGQNAHPQEKAQELCEKLYLAAKKSKTRRFHALYDKVYRMDILSSAWKQVKANRGSAGIDNESIDDVLLKGEDTVIAEIQQVLTNGKYRPRKVKRVNIPKPGGGKRPLGVPTVRDRIVQTAAKQVIEPIFEADFLDCSYGFRPNRCAHDALEEIRKTMNAGYQIVLDADIKGFFGNIDHNILLELVHQRISDRRVLKLIRKWLKCGVMESGFVREIDMGVPQGGVISPLLANIYLHEFDKFWTQQTRVKGKLIRYADDFVILFRTEEEAELGLKLVKTKMEELGLELNEGKTEIVDTRRGKGGFDFLGFHHRMIKSPKYKRYYVQKWPSRKAMKSVKSRIRSFLGQRAILSWELSDVVKKINHVLKGWLNYFRFGNSAKKFAQIDDYMHERLALWWSKKHQKSGRRWKHDFTWKKFRNSGIQLLNGNVRYWSYYSNAQERRSSESRVRENLTHGLMRVSW